MTAAVRAGAESVREALAAVLSRAREEATGVVADYIPELATADPDQLGVSVVSVLGHSYGAGDTAEPCTIQSVSKPFVYALVHERLGRADLHERVGFEPSGEPFNAISLDAAGRPANPMINAGAIMVSAMVDGRDREARFEVMRSGLSRFAGRELDVDERVYRSESTTGHRNRALASLMLAAGVLPRGVDDATDVYFRQCAIRVTSGDLATMAATLANGGVNPVTGITVVGPAAAQDTLSVMASCGMYDRSGEWAVLVGVPAKSGVGGGIAAAKPGQFGVGTYSPPLDAAGNSARGVAILTMLSNEYGLHLLAHPAEPASPVIGDSLGPDGRRTVALRGELDFVAVEQLLYDVDSASAASRTGIDVDLTQVTRITPVATRLLVASGERSLSTGGPAIGIIDPNGVLAVVRDEVDREPA